MKSTEQSVVNAMDGYDKKIFPYLPYILQDFWEIGADPDTLITMIEKHYKGNKKPGLLDLGCGKGAVSVKVASKLGCKCHGIDAIPEFIDFAKKKAKDYNVSDLCKFEVGDMREKIKNLKKYDIIILGAVGPVLGNYYDTFEKLKPCLNDDGLILVDDGYIPDDSDFRHPQTMKKQELLSQVVSAKMQLLDEVVWQQDEDAFKTYDKEYGFIVKRCNELIKKYPKKAHLFENYMKNQEQEFDNLKTKIICSTMVFGRTGY